MKVSLKIFALAILVIFSVTSCNRNLANKKEKSDNMESAGNIIKVASVGPLSGNNAVFGEVLKNGAQMAVEERKSEFKKLGFKLTFVPYDDQGEAKVGVSLAQKILNDKNILAVMGHFNSGVALPSSEIYKKDNLLMMSPANTAVKITERGIKSVDRIVARDDLQGPVAAQFTMTDLKAKKVFIIHDGTDYGKGIADEYQKTIKKLNGNIVGFEGIAVKDTDFSGVLAKVAQENPDALFFAGVCPEGPMILKQMREKNIKAYFIGPDGIDASDTLEIAGKNVIGSYYTSTAGISKKNQRTVDWSEKYQEKFNKKPENYSAYGYDAMMVTLNSIIKAIKDNDDKKPDRLQVTEAARNLPAYEGIATKVEFDNKGDNKEAYVFIYKYNEAKYPADIVKSMSAKEFKNQK